MKTKWQVLYLIYFVKKFLVQIDKCLFCPCQINRHVSSGVDTRITDTIYFIYSLQYFQTKLQTNRSIYLYKIFARLKKDKSIINIGELFFTEIIFYKFNSLLLLNNFFYRPQDHHKLKKYIIETISYKKCLIKNVIFAVILNFIYVSLEFIVFHLSYRLPL